MTDKFELQKIFEDTHARCESDPELCTAIDYSIENQKIYWADDSIEFTPRSGGPEAKVLVSDFGTVAAARNYPGKKVCVLNFASSVNPGGGVKNGSRAQEECVCRATTLYPCLADESTAYNVYSRHHDLISLGLMNRANSDDMIYTPGVIAVKEDSEHYPLLPVEKRYSFDVLSSAAPDLKPGKGEFFPDIDELIALFEKRIDRIFTVAAVNGAEVLILGAFGCGAFGNDPELVASVFRKLIPKYIHDFEVIDFAIPDRPSKYPGKLPNHRTFREVLGR